MGLSSSVTALAQAGVLWNSLDLMGFVAVGQGGGCSGLINLCEPGVGNGRVALDWVAGSSDSRVLLTGRLFSNKRRSRFNGGSLDLGNLNDISRSSKP
jgi:hypothetical protein